MRASVDALRRIPRLAHHLQHLLDVLGAVRLDRHAERDGVRVVAVRLELVVVERDDVRARLRDEYAVRVRDFSYAKGLGDCLRITVGTPNENDRLISALRDILQG